MVAKLESREDLRNIAIVAHVDHGKTTLVDGMLKQSGLFHQQKELQERLMDTNDLEREKGITILSKNTALKYEGVKINIVDTPGHADFGGEVERILKMVEGVLLIVDAWEGPMPQTKFVLRKALDLGLKPIVVINKIDRQQHRAYEVVDEVLDLFIELGADEEQLEFPVLYASALEGFAVEEPEEENDDLQPLLAKIVEEIPPPQGSLTAPFQMLVTSIEYSDYMGRLALGRVTRGQLSTGTQVAICKEGGETVSAEISGLYRYLGLEKVEVEEVKAGEIVAIAGLEEVEIGQTVADLEKPEALPFMEIEKPTVRMTFTTNDSPLAGQEGDYLTSRYLRRRLLKELESNVALEVEETDSPDTWRVAGRGSLHLAILIETMRREGYEFQVSKPEVIMKEEQGQQLEPIEELIVDISEELMGKVIEEVGQRKGEMQNMEQLSDERMRLQFEIPARGLIGLRTELLSLTKGEAVLNHTFSHYAPYKGDLPRRSHGSLVAASAGKATRFGIDNAQERGTIFVEVGTKVYKGMIVGANNRENDLDINICKEKELTNIRSVISDDAMQITPPKKMNLDESLEYIAEDEYVEVTPENIRLRKKILNQKQRIRAQKND
ncbi:translational GTPase TypA [Fuchsiella alkaliacetigena]|uniref:translational GTPase TypA n=1 Tax=Fuchsiella alkaliacetigena TaxID=957042 RepID=UPI00200B2702|nr:translational GTPase TypA [Fuchsiella alkaliacetigena]MCK8825560.1 translational GTPase TypA [Fuchsiella alkaliacetigena]